MRRLLRISLIVAVMLALVLGVIGTFNVYGHGKACPAIGWNGRAPACQLAWKDGKVPPTVPQGKVPPGVLPLVGWNG